jgi:poly(A) polymerase
MPHLFLVGGCVRDKFLGIDSKDIDFAFVLDDITQTVEQGFKQMSAWMEERGFQIFLSTPEMFTIRAKFPKGDKNEGMVADFVMARREVGYVEGTRRPILELGTIEDDLVRRDFTLNAMAEDMDGKLIDLFGGMEDLRAGILRTPLDARVTMMDDPLRLLRSWRFSITKGFVIHQDILETLNDEEIIKKLFKVVSNQRIREELFKMFKFDTVKTLELIQSMELLVPGLTKKLFSDMWLKPTVEE